jgi:hypothetical protein
MAMPARRRVILAFLGLLLVGACAPTASPAESAAPSTSSTPAPEGNLPPGCATIELRAPGGDRIVLDGTWIEDVENSPMTWWIRTLGDCVWGAGQIEEVPPEGTFEWGPDAVQSLAGRIGSDLVITGEILWLGPVPNGAPGNPARYSPLRMLIEFDDAGAVLLREDREPGVTGPRCPDPGGYCPAPLVLQRAD